MADRGSGEIHERLGLTPAERQHVRTAALQAPPLSSTQLEELGRLQAGRLANRKAKVA